MVDCTNKILHVLNNLNYTDNTKWKPLLTTSVMFGIKIITWAVQLEDCANNICHTGRKLNYITTKSEDRVNIMDGMIEIS